MPKSVLLSGLSATAVAALFALPAAAQTAGQPTNRGREIVVTAPVQQSEADVLSGTSIVTGEELQRSIRPTIGETLARQPGVSATSFGPNASRPVLRGFQGERIRVLTDGIGSIDVSNTSVDHAVVINPLLAERIEVLRGPSALLFGSSAVGGVVNVIDTRIPRTVPENGYRLSGMATYGSAATERSVAGATDVAVGKQFVVHADGSYLKTDNLKIGGYVLSPRARAEAQAAAAQAPRDPLNFGRLANLSGRLPNTASETWTAGVGGALITDTGSLGIAYSHYDSLYGVPIRYTLTPGGEKPEAPRLSLVQNRLDLRGEIETGGGFLDRIRLRAGAAQYRHYELEEDGGIGTAFYNKGIESRLELVQSKRDGWQGASGVQFFNRDFDVRGDEAFLPRNNTAQVGLFTLQQLDRGAFKMEAGARYEHTSLTARTAVADNRFFRGQRSFDAFSGSVGASYGFAPDWRAGLNLSRTERAPSAEELFANGPHAGTEAYELGNPNFKKEASWGIEATVHGHGEGYSFDASAYYNRFSNYIYDALVTQSPCVAAAAPSGRTVDLPCFQYAQADARYYGIEAEGSVRLATIGTYAINADLLGDYVHAQILNTGPAPRIPPLRLLGGLEAQSDRVNARVEVERSFRQSRVLGLETPTNGFTLVNASVQLKPWGAVNPTTLTLSANNIFDVDARRHASVLKDFAPLAGRDLRATLSFKL
ncbi:iron complex outermembrane receptor protein [Sphingomonas sp. SORGH_AS 950]|uniref:TonB-dependent receptor n=1 Tax=Sphingomonas sp. SORGH_AS_0950 TaxID=3041792 RepID=UPI00277E4C18|nr:TonB-dependent receptor [Sphingomonas sp. SORGH_AS_0950]MDQ1159366.1 iron complex outermembrane receptor protein [Sphingomonas sp. SORGH_AS_0950]